MSLASKLKNAENNLLLYGFTPPKTNNTPEKIASITQTRIKRLESIDVDGLLIYDIQDEASRMPDERPFPFLETVPSYEYALDHMGSVQKDKIVYLCVGKYTPDEFKTILRQLDPNSPVVFVGQPSPDAKVKMTLAEAYGIFQNLHAERTLGAVAIPERHALANDEHLRIKKKIEAGCGFFVTQCVYDVGLFKNMLSDYYYMCQDNEIPMKPIIMTLTPCGSPKTMEFIKWLGVQIPKWLENDVNAQVDTLEYSLRVCEDYYLTIRDFCQEKGIPLGCNIESVALKKEEVLASFDLARRIKAINSKKD